MRPRTAIVIIALHASSDFMDAPPWFDRGYSKEYELRYKQARRRRASRKAVSRWLKEQCVSPLLRKAKRVFQPPRNHVRWRRPG